MRRPPEGHLRDLGGPGHDGRQPPRRCRKVGHGRKSCFRKIGLAQAMRTNLFRPARMESRSSQIGEDPSRGTQSRRSARRRQRHGAGPLASSGWLAQMETASRGDDEIRAGWLKVWADRQHWSAALRWQMESLSMMTAERFREMRGVHRESPGESPGSNAVRRAEGRLRGSAAAASRGRSGISHD